MGRGVEQALRLVLPVDAREVRSQLLQQRHGHERAVDRRLALPEAWTSRRSTTSSPSAGRPCSSSSVRRSGLDDGLHGRTLLARSDEVGGSPVAQNEPERVYQDGLPGAGLARQEGQALPSSSSSVGMSAMLLILSSLIMKAARVAGYHSARGGCKCMMSTQIGQAGPLDVALIASLTATSYCGILMRQRYLERCRCLPRPSPAPGPGRPAFSGGIGGLLAHIGAVVATSVLVLCPLLPHLVGHHHLQGSGAAPRPRAVADVPPDLPQEQQVFRGELGLPPAPREPARRRLPGGIRRGQPAGPRRPAPAPPRHAHRAEPRVALALARARGDGGGHAPRAAAELPRHHRERQPVRGPLRNRLGDHERVRRHRPHGLGEPRGRRARHLGGAHHHGDGPRSPRSPRRSSSTSSAAA